MLQKSCLKIHEFTRQAGDVALATQKHRATQKPRFVYVARDLNIRLTRVRGLK